MTHRQKFIFMFCPTNPNNVNKEYKLMTKGEDRKYTLRHETCGRVFEICDFRRFVVGSCGCPSRPCITERKRKNYFKKHGVYNQFQLPKTIEKIKNTKMLRYGDAGYCNVDKIKNTKKERHGDSGYTNIKKRRKTLIARYGVDHNWKIKEKRRLLTQKHIDSGFYSNPKNKTEFMIYRQRVKSFTMRNSKVLFETWSGYDFYDGEDIKNNSTIYESKDNKYPSIDHKISIFNGFKNNMCPWYIGSIDNLCVTKRIINCKKSRNNTVGEKSQNPKSFGINKDIASTEKFN